MAVPRRPTASGQGSSYADVSELDKYKLISNIGKGSFGVISKVQRVTDGKEFALKQLDYSKMTEKDRKQILAEVAILDALKHRNIVQLVQKIKDPKNERIYIVMEYCTSGDLGTLIRKAQRSNQPIHEDKIWNIFLQITLALHHCHWPAERPSKLGVARISQGAQQTSDGGIARYQVLHRDLKPENVFLSDEFVKLGDFGLSKDMGTASFTSTYVGTPLYMPPEILAENRYDTKSDIWSLGCLVYEMCALHSPFSQAQTQPELISMVKSGKLPALPTQYSPALKSVIKAMLTLNPVKRPSTKDLLEMDEMKLHRKLFTVQNQTSLLLSKRDELKSYEEQLRAKTLALDEREKAISAKEAAIEAREAVCESKDEEAKETQKRLNQAAESLRGQWERLREEKEKLTAGLGGQEILADEPRPAKSSAPPLSRPGLEERSNTLPLPATSRFSRLAYPAYGDTPSKIPLAAISSPSPLDRFAHLGIQPQPKAATPLRRNATKSLGNLAAAAKLDAERDALAAQSSAMGAKANAIGEATPAKQIYRPLGGIHSRQRSSIGSPDDLKNYCEDISMAIATPMSIASPWLRPRRSSITPNLGHIQQPSSSSSAASGSTSTLSSDEGGLPPTMIPAPVPVKSTFTFTYKESATPAKWNIEDPDAPSPFIKRPSSTGSGGYTERQVLGSINLQQPTNATLIYPNLAKQDPSISKKSTTTTTNTTTSMPRSKSGNLNLHQHVLRHNAIVAGRTSGEGLPGTTGGKMRRIGGGGL
ncbi:uncharacterized protein I206_105941 [Kwoniella pini CBS 10737]|uniref:non-specific serine/threonine protein kinase n=1 Tax=Kwoniella pini CBS 10737 TaxID=1296096 RepID=A0A1B9I0M4_9TREE|nr:NEK protein kinase [Kwoniella pini CBS 10737]OCF49077.1 NEK protein kinase [Kwoniella pini CBS 10737]